MNCNGFQGLKINWRGLGCSLWVGVLGLLLLIGGFWGPPAYAESLAPPEQLANSEPSAGAESPENPGVAETIKFENSEIKLEANQITMDSAQKLIEARGQVRLLVKQSDTRFETEELNYDLEAKIVKIPGQVRFITKTGDFRVDTLTYNVKTLEGQGGALEGTLAETPRTVAVDGQKFETAGASKKVTLSGATLTRCPKPKPDYLFKAAKISIIDDRVSLTHILLYFKGIPIFYLPYFSFKIKENSNFPGIEGQLKYDNEQQALGLDYEASVPIDEQSDFLVKGSFSQGDDSNMGVGYGFRVGDLTNRSYLIKYFQGDWAFEDKVKFEIGGVNTTLTAAHDFGTQENSADLSLTKDFEGWLGDWRLGVQGHQVSKNVFDEEADQVKETGGVYGGYRLDYRPSQYLTLGYLRLDSFTDSSKYGDFDPNLGSSALYEVKVPVTGNFSFSLGGTYNLTELEWKSQTYGFAYDTCCYAINFQWDTIADTSRSLNLVFKF